MPTALIDDFVTQAELVGFISTATRDVFSTMLGEEIVPAEAFVKRSATTAASGVVSLMGLAGKWTGTGSLSCSAAFACRLSSLLLMDECCSVDENVLDAVAEVTNIIVGNVKTEIEERLGPMGLTVPTVIFGTNFQTRNAGNNEWIVVPFQWGEECMHVQVCLAPNREGSGRSVRPGFPIPHLVRM